MHLYMKHVAETLLNLNTDQFLKVNAFIMFYNPKDLYVRFKISSCVGVLIYDENDMVSV